MSTKIKFYKYQGAGNDFILIDDRNKGFDRNNVELVNRLCDRRFGIGADGLMLLQSSNEHDFEMVYYNADGKEGTMCGNGGRCIVAFARDLNIITEKTVFLAVDGVHDAEINDNQVNLGMIDVHEVSMDKEAYVLNTGSPHYVTKVNNLKQFDVYHEGHKIRNNDTYGTNGINVNFVEKQNEGYLLRTFERGVEDETLACGTGATAAAMAMALDEGKEGELSFPIQVMGGQLQISFLRDGNNFTNVYLKGPAEFVFSGEIDI